MAQTVLIIGPDSVLASNLAAHYLAASDDHVTVAIRRAETSAEEFGELVSRFATRTVIGHRAMMSEQARRQRLQIVASNSNSERHPLDSRISGGPRFDKVWYLPGGRYAAQQPHRAAAHDALSMFLGIDAREFNYVGNAHVNGRRKSPDLPENVEHRANDQAMECFLSMEAEVAQHCQANRQSYRIFRTSLIVEEDPGAAANGYNDFLSFIAAVHQFKEEIEEKSPDYFEFRSLRCRADPDAALDLLSADQAAQSMLRIAQDERTLSRINDVVSGRNTLFADFCEWVGTAYDMSFFPVADHRQLNAIDRILRDRLAWFWPYLGAGAQSADMSRHCDADAKVAAAEQERYQSVFAAARASQRARRATRNQRVNALLTGLERRTISRNSEELNYFTTSSNGMPVVLLNALGQGLHYWLRLIDCLMQNYRIIIWEPRGTVAPSGPFRLNDQVDDLEAILRQESIDRCHLVGWCTGPKVAVRFYLRRPAAVSSMVFLNSTFKCPGSPSDTITAYEKNIESLCRVIAERPGMAGPVTRSLQSILEQNKLDIDESSSEEFAQSVLGLVNVDLRLDVLAPFRNENTTINYAHQLVDFVFYDALADAARVKVPILLVASEYDKVSSPLMSHAAVKLFPDSRCVQVRGASHYCLYDRADLVAGLMETFFEDATRLPGDASEVFEIA